MKNEKGHVCPSLTPAPPPHCRWHGPRFSSHCFASLELQTSLDVSARTKGKDSLSNVIRAL